jgi:hypothetical protein
MLFVPPINEWYMRLFVQCSGPNPIMEFFNQNGELLHIAHDFMPMIDLTQVVCPNNATLRNDYIINLRRYVHGMASCGLECCTVLNIRLSYVALNEV